MAEHVGEDATRPFLPLDGVPDLQAAPTDKQLAMYDLLRWAKSVAVGEGIVSLRPGALDGTIRAEWTELDLQRMGVTIVRIAYIALGGTGARTNRDRIFKILEHA